MELVITPVIKNKEGDLTDINNYRAIAISTADAKILEKLLLPCMTSLADCNNYQFGFKAGHSTTLCAGVFRHTADYFVTGGSHVFVSFVDFSKAFDYVNYWKLFNQLLDCILVELLAYWYCNQEASIIWINSRCGTFYIANGTNKVEFCLHICLQDTLGRCCLLCLIAMLAVLLLILLSI